MTNEQIRIGKIDHMEMEIREKLIDILDNHKCGYTIEKEQVRYRINNEIDDEINLISFEYSGPIQNIKLLSKGDVQEYSTAEVKIQVMLPISEYSKLEIID